MPIIPAQISPILDVRIANGCKYGLKYAVFKRPAGQLQGGQILARFGSVDLAEEYVRLKTSRPAALRLLDSITRDGNVS